MSVEQRFAKQWTLTEADRVGAELDRVHARLGMERLRQLECELAFDEEGANECADEISQLEKDEARLLREMPEEGWY